MGHEEHIANIWLGMLAQRMWRSAGERAHERRSLQVAWFLSLALTYSDQDFQKLILNVEAKRKQQQRRSLGNVEVTDCTDECLARVVQPGRASNRSLQVA